MSSRKNRKVTLEVFLFSVKLIRLTCIIIYKVRILNKDRLHVFFSRKASGDPVLVDHKLRQSRLNREAVILSNEAVTDGFSPDGASIEDGNVTVPVEGATDCPDENSDPEVQPTTPKCFVNLMYEELPEIPNQQ